MSFTVFLVNVFQASTGARCRVQGAECKVQGRRVTMVAIGTGNRECRVMKRVIPIRRKAER
jgi:hypothetical protein